MPVRVNLQVAGQSVGIELKDGVYRFGRQKPADVVIADSTVSTNHAELQVDGGTWMIRDLGSTNGTFVNDAQIRGATRIGASDQLRLGSVNLKLDRVVEAAAPVERGPSVGTVKIQAAKEAAGRLQWNVRYWIAGAETIVFLLILLFFIQLYSSSTMAKQWGVNRYRLFAAQYTHVINDSTTVVPAPILDESLTEPIYVTDKTGRVLFPTTGEVAQKSSPLINPKTKTVYESAKNGIFELPGTADASGTPARSYPVRAGGELRGYVVARPAEVSDPTLKVSLMLILLSAPVALILLYFAMRPAQTLIASHLANLRLKLSPFANGFADALPRSESFAEANSLAAEIETAVQSVRGQAAKKGGTAGRSDRGDVNSLVGTLFSDSGIPYCFLDQDFKIIASSSDLRRIREFGGLSKGQSIFDAGLSSVQSKQLVQAIGEARRDRTAQTTLQLVRDGSSLQHAVTVRLLSEGQGGNELFGIFFNQQ